MIGLGDIINLIWVDGDKPIQNVTEDGETPKYKDGDSPQWYLEPFDSVRGYRLGI